MKYLLVLLLFTIGCGDTIVTLPEDADPAEGYWVGEVLSTVSRGRVDTLRVTFARGQAIGDWETWFSAQPYPTTYPTTGTYVVAGNRIGFEVMVGRQLITMDGTIDGDLMRVQGWARDETRLLFRQ